MMKTSRQMACAAALVLLATCGAQAAGGRQLLGAAPAVAGMAPAPAPGQQGPVADILFTLAAPRAVLAADKLTLKPASPQVTFYSTGAQTGVYTLADFANASAGAKFVTAEGSWLSKPTAVLRAMDATNNMTSVLLSLAQPHYDAASRTLTFKTKVLPAAGAKLPLMGGATHRVVEDAQNGLAAGVLAEAPADGELTDAALFIDQSAAELGPIAAVKWGWGWGGGWGGGGWGWGGGWGGGGGGNYGGGWGGGWHRWGR